MSGRRYRLLFAGLLIVAIVLWSAASVLIPVGGHGKSVVRIPKGATAGEVGEILASRHLIRSAFGFRLLSRVTRLGSRLRPGTYEIRPNMNSYDMLRMIAEGEVGVKWLTFPEGFTIQQMGDRLQAEGAGSSRKFTQDALYGGGAFHTSFPHPAGSLEGFLFPDTYAVPAGTSEKTVISEMLRSFESKVTKPFATDIAKSGMSLDQIVTLASLIEREAKVPSDRPLISAVLRNRLRKNMRLECDATVLYALGKHKQRVYFKDLEVDSPYNTYRNAGLPPGPIANPGLDSIKAAMHPANVDYLYYVARPDGSHIFSRTFEEHQRAKRDARKAN